MSYVCQYNRCGRCCELTSPNQWEEVVLTEEQKVRLLEERVKYPEYPEWQKCRYNYCKMLVFEDKLAVCLVHKLYGYEAKPTVCREYPKNGMCEGMKKEEIVT